MAYIGKNPKLNSLTYTPQSTEPTNPVTGMVYNDDGTNRDAGLYRYDGTDWVALGGGASGINYTQDAESSANWTSSDASFTIAENSSSPLRGSKDLIITKTAVNAIGETLELPFIIDNIDQAKRLLLSFNKNTSANYVDGDVSISIEDVTNAVTIPVTGEDIKAGDLDQVSTFQTSSNSISYKLVLTVNSTNALAYTIQLDNVSVGPQNIAYGQIRETQQGSLTGASFLGNLRRFNTSTTPDNLNLLAYTDDGTNATRLTALRDNVKVVVNYQENSNGTNQNSVSFIRVNGVTASQAWGFESGLSLEFVNSASVTLNTGDYLDFAVNVSGRFSGNGKVSYLASQEQVAQVSQDFAGRDVIVSAAGNAGQSITANVTDIPFTEVEDNLAAWDGAVFTVPENGQYIISGQVLATTVAINGLFVYIDGVEDKLVSFEGLTTALAQINTIVELQKGQTLSIRSETSFTLDSAQPKKHTLDIRKLGSSQQLLETETVAARLTTDAAGSYPSSTTTIIAFVDTDFDTHGGANGTGYILPYSGKYKICCQAFFSGVTTGQMLISIQKNGTDTTIGPFGFASAGELSASVSDLIEGEAGDIITASIFHGTGSTESLNTGSAGTRNFFTIEKVK